MIKIRVTGTLHADDEFKPDSTEMWINPDHIMLVDKRIRHGGVPIIMSRGPGLIVSIASADTLVRMIHRHDAD